MKFIWFFFFNFFIYFKILSQVKDFIPFEPDKKDFAKELEIYFPGKNILLIGESDHLNISQIETIFKFISHLKSKNKLGKILMEVPYENNYKKNIGNRIFSSIGQYGHDKRLIKNYVALIKSNPNIYFSDISLDSTKIANIIYGGKRDDFLCSSDNEVCFQEEMGRLKSGLTSSVIIRDIFKYGYQIPYCESGHSNYIPFDGEIINGKVLSSKEKRAYCDSIKDISIKAWIKRENESFKNLKFLLRSMDTSKINIVWFAGSHICKDVSKFSYLYFHESKINLGKMVRDHYKDKTIHIGFISGSGTRGEEYFDKVKNKKFKNYFKVMIPEEGSPEKFLKDNKCDDGLLILDAQNHSLKKFSKINLGGDGYVDCDPADVYDAVFYIKKQSHAELIHPDEVRKIIKENLKED